MAAHQSVLRISKSIAGAILLIFGMFVLYEHLAAAVARLSHVLANGSAALGVLPAVALAVSQAVHAYGFDCHRFLQGLSQQMLISSWPLLLVIFGTVLSMDSFTDKSSGQD